MDDVKPKGPNWLAIIGGIAGILGTGWAVAQWAATTPTRKEFNDVRDDMIRVRIELPTMGAKLERVEQGQNRIEKAVERIEAKQGLEQTRRRPRAVVDDRP
jgi:hypothetical protein